MTVSQAKTIVQQLFEAADVCINGDRPWDITANNEQLYDRVLGGGSLALGESYMDGWWESRQLDEFINKLLRSDIEKSIKRNWVALWLVVKNVLFNTQRQTKAFEVGEKHYDIGNDLYQIMLDQRMVYTCGYWRDAKTLDEAQEAKLDLTCRKLGLVPGMKVLDIGCGWGSFAKYAAEKYGVQVTGVTISQEQAELGNKLCAGLPVEIKLLDYRKITGNYDRIASLGMYEHVGYKNYRTYMQVAYDHLANGGLFLLHTIGMNVSAVAGEPWLDKYIFPNGMLPSVKQISIAIEGLFVLEDWHNFGPDYDRTLLAWYDNFVAGWPKLKEKYGDRFYRMWSYYLLSCAGAFRSRNLQLWQIVLAKNPGKPYFSIR